MSTDFLPQRIAVLLVLAILGFGLHVIDSKASADSTTRFDYHDRICNHCFVENRKHYEPCWKGGCKKCDAKCCPGDPGHDCCCIHNVDECKCVKPEPKPDDPTLATSPPKKL